jgi:hypothetical protein
VPGRILGTKCSVNVWWMNQHTYTYI